MTEEIMLFLCKKSKDNDVLVITYSNRAAQRAKKKFRKFVLGALVLPCNEVKNSIFIFDNHRVVFCGPDVLRNWNDKYSGLIYFDFPEVFYSQKRNHCPGPQLLQDAIMDDRVTFPEADCEIEKLLQEDSNGCHKENPDQGSAGYYIGTQFYEVFE